MSDEKTFGIIFTNPKIPILEYKTNDVEIGVGSLVEVPLGNRVVLGVVWRDGAPEFKPEDLKSILKVVGSFKLSDEVMIFLKKAHTYTLSPLQSFLKMAIQNLSFHKQERPNIVFENNSLSSKKLTQKQVEVVEVLKKFPQKKASFKKL